MRPFSTNLPRLFSIDSRARSSAVAAASISRTSNPACANTWAMPLPIVPAPTTPIRLMNIAGQNRASEAPEAIETTGRALCQGGRLAAAPRTADGGLRTAVLHALHRQRDAVAAAQAQGGDAAPG